MAKFTSAMLSPFYWIYRLIKGPDAAESKAVQAMTSVQPNSDGLMPSSGIGSSLGNLGGVLNDLGSALVNKYLDTSMTSGEKERQDYAFGLNEMAADNADARQRALMRDQYQIQTGGMQAAGLNPALMYNNGLGSTPTAAQGSGSSGAGSASMENLLSVIP